MADGGKRVNKNACIIVICCFQAHKILAFLRKEKKKTYEAPTSGFKK